MPEHPFRASDRVPDAIRRLPKCNLHTHLEGSVRPATLVELARAQGLSLAVPEAAVSAAMQVSGKETSLVDYLAKISFAYPILRSAQALQRVSREAAQDAARCNVRYFELRAGPATHATAGLPVSGAIAAILAGLAEAEAETGMTCRLIVAALRHHSPDVNAGLARTALEFRGAGVVGFDLAGDELHFPAAPHREAFRIARAGGLGITVHAGEAGGSEEVDYAVETLGATRIGHGVHAIENPRTVQMLVDRQVTLEICPTSNVHTATVPSIEAHPVAQLVRRGVRVTIGDDDPITSRTDVSGELTLLSRVFGFSLDDLRGFQVAGIRSSFLEDEACRARLLAECAAV
jgi:adenosine deaminase